MRGFQFRDGNDDNVFILLPQSSFLIPTYPDDGWSDYDNNSKERKIIIYKHFSSFLQPPPIVTAAMISQNDDCFCFFLTREQKRGNKVISSIYF